MALTGILRKLLIPPGSVIDPKMHGSLPGPSRPKEFIWMHCCAPWFMAASKNFIFSLRSLGTSWSGPRPTSSANDGVADLGLRRGGDWASAKPPRAGLATGDMGQVLLGGAALGFGVVRIGSITGSSIARRALATACGLGWRPAFGGVLESELTDSMLRLRADVIARM